MEMTFRNTVEGMELAAAHVGGLVKACVQFQIMQKQDETVVRLTGGH